MVAGSTGAQADSPIMAEFVTVNLALKIYSTKRWKPDHICCAYPRILQFLKSFSPCIAWHISEEYHTLKKSLENLGNPFIKTISRDDNKAIDALANFGKMNFHLSLFFQGMEQPN